MGRGREGERRARKRERELDLRAVASLDGQRVHTPHLSPTSLSTRLAFWALEGRGVPQPNHPVLRPRGEEAAGEVPAHRTDPTVVRSDDTCAAALIHIPQTHLQGSEGVE